MAKGGSEIGTAEQTFRLDRLIVGGALAGIVALAWLYLADTALDMGSMDRSVGGADMTMTRMIGMPTTSAWSASDTVAVLVMWVVMMVGMMLPAAAPLILIFTKISRNAGAQGGPYVGTGFFSLGYVVVWAGFSVVAVAAQWALQHAALLSPMMVSTSAYLGGGLLVVAGIYQLTPLKYACLRQCRSPMFFLLNRWRAGLVGALRMGIEHGAYCVGCCWALMALLFFLGVMNLIWIATLAALVLAEKVLPYGVWLARVFGLSMIGFGIYVVTGP